MFVQIISKRANMRFNSQNYDLGTTTIVLHRETGAKPIYIDEAGFNLHGKGWGIIGYTPRINSL